MNINDVVAALRTKPNVEKVTYFPTSGRVVVDFPRALGGRGTFTVPGAKALLERIEARENPNKEVK